MSRSSHDYLRHIRDECLYLIESSRDLDVTYFLRDETLKRAYVRSLEVIGEAAKQVPDEFRSRYPKVEWRAMSGMRDRLIHGYFGIDYYLVWDVVRNKVPTLLDHIARILAEEDRR